MKLGRDRHRVGLRLRRAGAGVRVDTPDYDAVKLEERELEAAEERRLFYVAMTRAQERLIVSGAAKLGAWEEGNRLAPIGWVGPALVPDIATRAASAAVAALAPEPFISEFGVVTTFVTVPPPDSGDVERLTGGQGRPHLGLAPPPPEPDGGPTLSSLSYSAFAVYEQCGYRFYAERVLGLPERPAAADPASEAEQRAAPLQPSRSAPGLSGAERGTLIHELLASLDFREPALGDPMPPDVRGVLAALVGSLTFARLAALRDVRREQRFAFHHGELLITGVFDLLAREQADGLLVLDYKSDRLAQADPARIVAERYSAQRTIYALAALKLGAATVEVVHLFLEAPEEPVSATFTAADIPALELDLAERVAGPLTGDFSVTGAPGRRVCEGCPAQGGLCSYPLEVTSR